MVSLFIIMIVTLSLVSAAGYSIITFLKANETTTMVLRNTSRLELTAKLVEANLRTVGAGGAYHAPMGAVIGGLTVVPPWVSADASTPWGQPYSYCPYAPQSAAGGGAPATIYTAGGSYAVQALARSVEGVPRDYVSGGATASASVPGLGAAGNDILALIISPTYGASAMPDCSSVTYNSGSFRVPGGSVAVVRSANNGSIAIGYETVSQVCASPLTTCTAECGSPTKKVLFGECLGGDTLRSFEAIESPPSWNCTWAQATGPNVTTRVTCADIR